MSSHALVRRLIALEPFGTAYYVAGLMLPYVLVSAAFAFCYVFIPNTRVRLRPALVGGLVAGVAWKLSGSLFTAFVADSAQYSAIYSGFAVVLVFMIWVYLSWVIVLLGGSVAFHCQYPCYLRYAGRRPRLSTMGRERLGVLVMVLIGRSQLAGEPAWTLHRLADAVELPWEAVQKVLDALRQAGLLRVLDHDADAYLLARDTDCILLQDIIRALRSQGETPEFAAGRTDPALGRLLAQVAADCAGLAGERSLRDVVGELSGEFGQCRSVEG
jgi:membrane protein